MNELEERLRYLIENATTWIQSQRERYRSFAVPLTDTERDALVGLFEPGTLDAVRIHRVPTIENPTFYEQLGEVPLDFTVMAAITYNDVVVVSDTRVTGPTPITLVFHELVHVVQYRILGVAEFARQYVRGWAENGFQYSAIPLEQEAYALQTRFADGLLAGRSAESVIRSAHRL